MPTAIFEIEVAFLKGRATEAVARVRDTLNRTPTVCIQDGRVTVGLANWFTGGVCARDAKRALVAAGLKVTGYCEDDLGDFDCPKRYVTLYVSD